MPSSNQISSFTSAINAVSGATADYCNVPDDTTPTGAASLTQQEMKRLLDKIDLSDGSTILHFGAKPQQQLAAVSTQVTAVIGQDTQPLSQQLEKMIRILKQFDINQLYPRIQPNWMKRLFGHAEPMLYFLQQYLHVRAQLQQLIISVKTYRADCQVKMTRLERLYDAKLHYARELERFVAAGEMKLHELDTETLPRLTEKVNTSDNDPIRLQTLQDLHHTREDLYRRIEELREARNHALQLLPGMQSTQETDKVLLTELAALLEKVFPTWQQQLTEALRVERLLDRFDTTFSANTDDNDADNSAATTTEPKSKRATEAPSLNTIRREIFDISAIKAANKRLLDSLQAMLQLARTN